MAALLAYDTEYPADAVEFCPHPQALDILVCGTYQLQEERRTESGRKRLGRCYVFSRQGGQLTELQRFDLPAILDMKWSHAPDPIGPKLAIADAEGRVIIYRWDIVERKLSLVETVTVVDQDTLCLSLDWTGRVSHSNNESLVVSNSDGTVSVISTQPGAGQSRVTNAWKAHDFEPWIAAWDYWYGGNVVYSGGDDCRFKGWDLRQGVSSPTFTNKGFEAGVTSIQSHPFEEHVLALGSYDSFVRLFDTRKPNTPLQEMDAGGGVWRVKWCPEVSRKKDLLVACMHDGFKILRMGSEGDDGELLQATGYQTVVRFDEHKSLAYGADWSYAGGDVVASCSFYDHLLYIWKS